MSALSISTCLAIFLAGVGLGSFIQEWLFKMYLVDTGHASYEQSGKWYLKEWEEWREAQ